ncbi:MAG: UDP-N-acetylmuramate dehydrogenase [Dysgonamonadaceae bacterium]|jgi:UDP-N-acetylmuramate dehydrogenase|nr:UDP-N-acetylmuramate dehydrogenase [Dysgonamonadaceae bacterium]
MTIRENYPLLRHNTFGIEAKTRWFVTYNDERELLKILADEYFLSQPFLHIGSGSNLLFISDYEGVILHSGIKDVAVERDDERFVYLKAGAGMVWDDLVVYAVEHGWGGLENLSGIPGEVGASAVQNIGAYGCEAKDAITEITAYDIRTGKKQIIQNAECQYAYRDSIFKKAWKGRYIIAYVTFRLSKLPQYNLEYGQLKACVDAGAISLKTIREAVLAIRADKLPDPKTLGNAGSFFMNPHICTAHYEGLKKTYPDMPCYPVSREVVKIPAAWLIEQCGWKGFREGQVAVYEKQPLVLVNKGGATGKDIARLAEKVQVSVKNKFHIDITPEVTYIP